MDKAEKVRAKAITLAPPSGQPPIENLARRSANDPTDIYYLSNDPAKTDKTDLVRQAGLRWRVEAALEEGESEPGMDHYETRTWRSWHHHMTLTFLAHHFLARLRLKMKKVSGTDAFTK